jgi:phosphoribosylformylglycinamidine cyclo-ligase
MTNTFNLGIGMVLAVDAKHVKYVINALQQAGEQAYQIGKLIPGTQQVNLKGELQ